MRRKRCEPIRARAGATALVVTLALCPASTWGQESGSDHDADYDYQGQGDDWYGRRSLPRPKRDYAPPLLDQVLSGEDFCLGYERAFDRLGLGAPLFRTQGRPYAFHFRFSAADPDFPCLGGNNGCSDGNPCTIDGFDPVLLRCVSTPKPDGTACSDGLFCNGPETCQSGACAAGPAPACDDGNACTIDSCDPAADACLSVLLPVPGETGGLLVSLLTGTATALLEWSAAPGADRHHLYRGTTGDLSDLNCYQPGLRGTSATDLGEIPAAGGAFYFLTTGVNCAGEGSLGTDSGGGERKNRNPCP